MGIESGPSGYSSSERPQLSPIDRKIAAAINDPEASAILLEENPIAWIKGAIAVNTERGASQVSNSELLVRYMEGGSVEWDPQVAASVRQYLRRMGFL